MQIRIIEPEEVETFRRVRLRALKEHPEAFGSSYEEAKMIPVEALRERLVHSDTTFVLGAFTESDLVGMVGFRQETSKKMRHKGDIWGMYVSNEYQGQGIGRQLLTELILRVEKLPEIEQINLMVVDSNRGALQLYESCGFTIYGTEIAALKMDEHEYANEHLMVKKLEG